MVAHACNPATREAEAGESLEPRRRRLQCAEIAPVHSSLGDRGRLRLGKKKKRKRIMVILKGEDWRPHSGQGCPKWGTWAVTLPLLISQIGIAMLVSVGNLEEAGESVSFQLQIRRY